MLENSSYKLTKNRERELKTKGFIYSYTFLNTSTSKVLVLIVLRMPLVTDHAPVCGCGGTGQMCKKV